MPGPADDVSNPRLPQLALQCLKSGLLVLLPLLPEPPEPPGAQLASTVQWPEPVAAQPPMAQGLESARYRFAVEQVEWERGAEKYRPRTRRPTNH